MQYARDFILKCKYCGEAITKKAYPDVRGINFQSRKYCNRACMGKAFSKDRTDVARGHYKKNSI